MHPSDPRLAAVVASCAPSWCVAVPPPGPGVCATCSAGTPLDQPICTTCRRLAGASSVALRPVSVLSLAPAGSGIYRLLLRAKHAPPPAMALRASMVAELVVAHLARHGRCVAPEGWDRVCAVPSLRPRDGHHPLGRVVEGILERDSPVGSARAGRLALRPSPAAGQLRRGLAIPDAFVTDSRAADARILLIDDVYTSGAHMQSAIACLLAAGARSVAALVIGRRVAAHRSDNAALLRWADQPAHQWSWDRCGSCPPIGAGPSLAGRRRAPGPRVGPGPALSGPDRRGAGCGPR